MKVKPPNYLYKYRIIDQHTINLIVQNEAYFPLAEEFSDPFDCSVIPIPIYSEIDVERYIQSFKSLGNYEKVIQNIREKGPDETFFSNWGQLVDWEKKRTRVFCLTERSDNSIMFSHYAAGHKGLCLEFKYEDIPFFQNLAKVHYPTPDEYPRIKFFDNSPDILNGSRVQELIHIHYYTKQEDWKYEQEWRIVRQERRDGESKNQKIKFPEHILTGIIFGCYSSKEDIQLIKELTRKRSCKIHLSKAIKEDRSFKLKIEPLE